MPYETARAEALDLARFIKALGFKVYLAGNVRSPDRGLYGYITDDTGSRVLCFNTPDDSLSGAHGPASAHCGTGWRMDETLSSLKTAEDVRHALYAPIPGWIFRDSRFVERPKLTPSTQAQYQASYQSSSQFEEV